MMLGPMKKKMITTGVIAFLVPTIVLGCLWGAYASNKNKKIEELEEKAKTTFRLVFSGDMPIDHIIRSSDLKEVEVKAESAPADSFEYIHMEEIVGQRLRVEAKDKTIVTASMFFPEDGELNDDVRMKEFNMLTLPSDLEKGDFVDIRISFPTGEDYIVVAGEEIKQLGATSETNTIFLELTEEEILRLSGAIIESYISDSIEVYAVKYVDPIQQLFEEKNVNYVELYQNTVAKLIEEGTTTVTDVQQERMIDEETGRVMKNESGEIMYKEISVEKKVVPTEADFTTEQIAIAAGMSVETTQVVRKALAENDELLIAAYSSKLVSTRKTLTENYPVREEVAKLVASNPNIIDQIKVKYNVEALEQQRDSLIDTSIYDYDEYTGEIEENKTAIGNVASGLDDKIDTQKSERREYLQNLIMNSMVVK